MPVDRGELRYSIKLTTGATFASLRKFRQELKANRAEFQAFRAELRAGGRDAAVAARGLQQAGAALDQFGASRRAKQALSQQIRDARRARRAFSLIVRELRQIRAELVQVRLQSKKTGDSLERTGRRAERAGRRGARGFRRLRGEIVATRGSADRLAGSFLRMGGIISTFIIAQGVITGIRSLIETSLQFNRTIERSELGIAAILIAVGEVRGAFGETVDQATQLTLATSEARRQTQLLRRDALTTAATFTQLLDTFQIALAPGLTAGLDVDEVRRFALRISQAALALGVAQNQLSEEIRSILSGTIRPQTTRIAVALGITNEQIKRARELGQLTAFLEERFAAFGEAGKRALDTVDGLIGRVIDGFSQLAGEAGASVGFFDDVKDSLRELLNLFLDFDEFGFPQPDPRTLQILQVFFQAIAEGFNTIREGLAEITFDDAISAARGLANTLIVGLEIIIGIVQGVTDGFSILGQVIRGVAEALGFEEGEASIREITRALVSILVVLVSMRAAFGLVFGVIQPILSAATLLLNIFRRMPIAIRRIGAAFLTVILGVNLLIRALTGIDLSFIETIEVIKLSFQELFDRIRIGGKLAFEFLGNALFSAFTNPLGFIADRVQDLINIILGSAALLAAVFPGFEDARKGLENLLAGIQRFAEDNKSVPLFDTERTRAELDAALEESAARFEEFERKRRARVEKEKADTAALKAGASAASKSIIDGLNLQGKAAETLSETLERISSSFSTARTVIQQVTSVADRLRLSLETLDLQERFAIDPDVTGLAGQVQVALQREQVTLGRELLTIRKQQLALELTLGRASDAAAASQRALNALSADERQIVAAIDQALRQRITIGRTLSRLESERALARVAERSAVERGATDEAETARKQRDALTQRILGLREQRAEFKKQIDQIQQAGNLDKDLLQFIRERLDALSTEAGLKQDLANITKTIADLEASSLEVQRRTAERIAERGLRDAQNRATQLRIQVGLLREIADIESGPGPRGAASRLAQLVAQTQQLRLQQSIQREQQLRDARSLADSIVLLTAKGKTTTALEEQLAALLSQINAQAQLNVLEEERLTREKERARILAEGTTGEAIQLGVEDFIEQIGTIQEQLAALTTNLLQTLSQGLTNAFVGSIVNAFDEQGRFVTEQFLENLQQAAGQLLQTIATQILQTVVNNIISTLLQAIITTSVTQTTAATTAAGIETAAANLNAATKVTAATIAADIEIAAAQTAALIRSASSGIGGAAGAASTGGLIPPGFDGGGTVPGHRRVTPPPGVARSDTVPAYLTPGEFVQRVSAVRHYGVDIMRALNRRMIDPSLLKGLAGIKTLRSFQTSTSRGPGFQEGGSVDNVRQIAASIQAQAGAAVATDTPPAVGIPMNDVTFETILSSGREAFRRFLRDNAHDFDGILRGGRTGG